ncbi:MAG TPA: hypothetical protein VM695_07760 [Phycisphaerae bacterium]|nr:hypothetical protein [Phycisphaerae bacterium]
MWYKRTIPLALVFVAGLLGFVHEYIPHPLSGEFREEVTTSIRIIGGFGLFIGAYSLLHMHFSRIRRRQSGWGYSVFVFLGAAVMIFLGLWNEGDGPLVDPQPDVMTSLQWGYYYVLVPCQATIFSILAFFMASAAFRTFRVRNLSAALLLGAAIIVMFGRVPISEEFGRLLFGEGGSQLFPKASQVLMDYPNLAAKRGILLGVSLGAIAQSLRILFGIERSYMGGGD